MLSALLLQSTFCFAGSPLSPTIFFSFPSIIKFCHHPKQFTEIFESQCRRSLQTGTIRILSQHNQSRTLIYFIFPFFFYSATTAFQISFSCFIFSIFFSGARIFLLNNGENDRTVGALTRWAENGVPVQLNCLRSVLFIFYLLSFLFKIWKIFKEIINSF